MKFTPVKYETIWANRLESRLESLCVDIQIQCMVEFGVDVGVEFTIEKSKIKPDEKILSGFYFYLYDNPDIRFECAEDLRHALKNKAFI